ncbi:sugar phosphate nucleotidyltransferase [Ectobacillus polymachus]|uniref:sugar phosphate nucleotidyltransferase n=1 Tax=Ectobacillus polymachus TaxID=1508806 RepID=UPI003A889DBE
MKLILLSGGSGKRLWPLSNDYRSKQFLKMLVSPENKLESMVQRIWRQLGLSGLLDVTYISTNNNQADVIQSQLDTGVPIIIEPERRDTFPAIALAAAYLYSILGVNENEVITVMPVDPFVENRFFDKVKDLEWVIRQEDVEIGLIGVNPTYASTKYGYIIPSEKLQIYSKVKGFKEKPSEEQAKRLLTQDALWNCGVFAFRLGYMMNQLEERGLPTQYDELIQHYGKLPKISFDYEIVEKAKQIVVIPYNGYWKDLGTWNTLTDEMQTNIIGRGSMSEDCKGTHIINELDIPVVVVGMSNLVVATSSDGILISDKKSSHQIKEIVKDFDRRPMFEERRWGWYRVLDCKESPDGTKVLTKRLCVLAGKNISYQYHHNRSEVWVIVSGEGEFVLDDVISYVKAGDVLNIPIGGKHGIKAIKELEMIEVQMGSKLEEDDIVRLFLSWEDMKEEIEGKRNNTSR